MAKFKFSVGDKVETSTGMEGKVVAIDPNRGKVAVKASNDGVGHSKGNERAFFEGEVRKA
jgi:preprotein translocase subunit YajC